MTPPSPREERVIRRSSKHTQDPTVDEWANAWEEPEHEPGVAPGHPATPTLPEHVVGRIDEIDTAVGSGGWLNGLVRLAVVIGGTAALRRWLSPDFDWWMMLVIVAAIETPFRMWSKRRKHERYLAHRDELRMLLDSAGVARADAARLLDSLEDVLYLDDLVRDDKDWEF